MLTRERQHISEDGTMLSKGGTAANFQIRIFSLVGGVVPLEDFMVSSRGGTIPSDGGIMTGGRQHSFRGGIIPTEGDIMIS